MTQSPKQIPEVWLVVPLYNEESVIGEVISEARQTFPHIVVVDDGSSDAGAERAKAAGAVVLRHAVNLGQGAALQTGITFVRKFTAAPYLATFDADGQHQTTDVAAMYDLARQRDLAVVFGSRFLADKVEASFLKRLVLKTAAWFTARSTSMRLTDAHNGLRLLRRDAMFAVNMRQNRMAHASEIVGQIGKSGLPWAEAPVHIRYTDYSRAKGQSLWNSVNILTDLLLG